MSIDTEPTELPRIAIVVGSTRPGRRSRLVADWVRHCAEQYLDGRASIELLDIADFELPLLDEPVPAAIGQYTRPHTLRWAEQVGRCDGFVFVTPEYNHAMPASLKNAIDYLFAEWNDRAAGFVSYGLTGGVRAVEQLRLSLAEVKVATVRSQVALSLFSDFELPDMLEVGELAPGGHHGAVLERMLDEIVDWANALRGLRSRASV